MDFATGAILVSAFGGRPAAKEGRCRLTSAAAGTVDVPWLIAAVLLGVLLVRCASASATTTITSVPPSPTIAGGSYAVSATSSTGRPVWLRASGACSLTKPSAEQSLPKTNPPIVEPIRLPPRGESPQTVYLDAIGMCSITAAVGEGPVIEVEGVSQSFLVSKDPSELISFASTPNSPTVGGSYEPSVQSSAGIELEFAIAAPSVCPISLGSLGEKLGSVSFVSGGTCTIDVWQAGSSEAEPPEAQQSFTVAKAAQQIVFSSLAPAVPLVGGPNYAVSAGSLMHLPVILSSKTPSVCAIQDEQTHGGLAEAEGWPSTSAEVRFINAGQCTLAASNEGSPQYAATEAQQSFLVQTASMPVRPTINDEGGTQHAATEAQPSVVKQAAGVPGLLRPASSSPPARTWITRAQWSSSDPRSVLRASSAGRSPISWLPGRGRSSPKGR